MDLIRFDDGHRSLLCGVLLSVRVTRRQGLRGLQHLLMLLCLCFVPGCGGSSKTESNSPTRQSGETLQRVTEKGPVRLTIRITPAEPRLSDLVDMEVQVVAEPEVEIRPPAFGTGVGDFLVRDYSERTAEAKNADLDNSEDPGAETETAGRNVRTFRYQLEPVRSGIHLIRAFPIEFVDNRATSESRGKTSLIESDPVEVKVTSELDGEVPDLAQLEPMLPPQPIEERGSVWWILLAAVTIVVAAWAIVSRRQRRTTTLVAPEKSPEELAQAALAQLLSENLPGQGLYKEFYVRLTGIVRVYIEGRTGLRAPEQTTEEFLREMRMSRAFEAERSVRLQEFLEAADMVKYAGQQPGIEQLEQSILRAREFITS